MNFFDLLVQEKLLCDLRHYYRNTALFVEPRDLGFGCVLDECLGQCELWAESYPNSPPSF